MKPMPAEQAMPARRRFPCNPTNGIVIHQVPLASILYESLKRQDKLNELGAFPAGELKVQKSIAEREMQSWRYAPRIFEIYSLRGFWTVSALKRNGNPRENQEGDRAR
jgi:hypothetical protein